MLQSVEKLREARLQRMHAYTIEVREWLRRLRNRERPGCSMTERDIGNNNTHNSLCLSNHLCKQRCINFIYSSLHWICQHVPPVLIDFLASNFIHACASIIRVHFIVSSGSPQTMPCLTLVEHNE